MFSGLRSDSIFLPVVSSLMEACKLQQQLHGDGLHQEHCGPRISSFVHVTMLKSRGHLDTLPWLLHLLYGDCKGSSGSCRALVSIASIRAHKHLVVAQVSHSYIRTGTIYVMLYISHDFTVHLSTSLLHINKEHQQHATFLTKISNTLAKWQKTDHLYHWRRHQNQRTADLDLPEILDHTERLQDTISSVLLTDHNYQQQPRVPHTASTWFSKIYHSFKSKWVTKPILYCLKIMLRLVNDVLKTKYIYW